MYSSPFIYGMLFAAILFEALGVSFLERSDGMSRLYPTLACFAFYAASFVVGAYVLRFIPMGTYYAIWTGVGVILVGILGYAINKQVLDLPALIGMGLILAGVIVIYLFSKSVAS